MFTSPQFAPWLIGGLIAVSLTLYATWALFGDRAHGRRRCLKCGHPFGDLPGLRCPECGFEAKKDRDLLKARRHWGRATTALVLLFVSAFIIRAQATPGGWISIVPSHALIWSIAIDGRDGPGLITRELKRRLLANELSESASDALLDRVIEGDSAAPPGSDGWELRYGQLAMAWRDRILQPDDPRTDRFIRIAPMFNLELPDTWPANEPIPALLSARDWWPWGTEAMLELHWPGVDGQASEPIERIGLRNYSGGRRPHPIKLPPVAEWPEGGTAGLKISVQVRRPDKPSTDDQLAGEEVTWTEWATPISQQLDVSRPLDGDAFELPPVRNEQIDSVVQRIFAPGLRRWKGRRRPFAIRFNTRATSDPATQDLLIGSLVEIIEQTPEGEEHVRRRSRVWTSGNRNRPVLAGWTISEEDTEGLARRFDENNRSEWVMRVRGDRDLAVRALAQTGGNPGDFQGWWSGEIEFPLVIANEANRPFIRQWFLEDGPPLPE